MGRTLILFLAACSTGWCVEPVKKDAASEGVFVTCHGKLRTGIVAAGGETTGTTIGFNDLLWELKLPDEATKKFAETHHKKEVTVTGRLTRVNGLAIPQRWIVEVEQLTPQLPKAPNNTATITFTGKLGEANRTAPASIEVGNESWPIVWKPGAELQNEAMGLAGKPVKASGIVERNKNGGNLPIFRIDHVQP